MSYKTEEIEGIGPAFAEKLKAIDIISTEELLTAGATKKGRQHIAETTGISESTILTWVNHADLFRVKGVAGQFSELLEAAGVDTVKEFATRNPDNLFDKLKGTNDKLNLSGRFPSVDALKDMIAHAKTLTQAVFH